MNGRETDNSHIPPMFLRELDSLLCDGCRQALGQLLQLREKGEIDRREKADAEVRRRQADFEARMEGVVE